MKTKVLLLSFVIMTTMFISCENKPDDNSLGTSKSASGISSARSFWISDDEDNPNGHAPDNYFDHHNFVTTIQGKWVLFVGKNGSLSIDGNTFLLTDNEFNLTVNGDFTMDNVKGFFGNGNVFDYILDIPGQQRRHLQMILESDNILRIGIFVTKNGKQTHKVVVYKKASR